MKKRIFALVCSALLLFVFSAVVLADEDIDAEDAGTTPDSFLYMFDRMGERLQLMFTFNTQEKAKLHIRFANERLAEMEAMADAGNEDLTESMNDEYENEMGYAQATYELMQQAGLNTTEIEEYMGNWTTVHIIVMRRVQNKTTAHVRARIEENVNGTMVRRTLMIHQFVKSNPALAAHLRVKLAEKIMDKIRNRVDAGDTDIDDDMEELDEEMEGADEALEEANKTGKSLHDVLAIVGNATAKHLEVLERVLAKVPDSAKPAIQRAINTSTQNRERLLNKIRARIQSNTGATTTTTTITDTTTTTIEGETTTTTQAPSGGGGTTSTTAQATTTTTAPQGQNNYSVVVAEGIGVDIV